MVLSDENVTKKTVPEKILGQRLCRTMGRALIRSGEMVTIAFIRPKNRRPSGLLARPKHSLRPVAH
jgi:hypothetical protein